MFSTANDRDLSVEIDLAETDENLPASPHIPIRRVLLTLDRKTHVCRATIATDVTNWQKGDGEFSYANSVLQHSLQGTVGDLGPLRSAASVLASTLYVPSFRNAINAGATQNYFDIDVGQAFIESWRSNKTGPNRKIRDATIQLTEDVRRVFDFGSLEINPSSDESTLQMVIEGRSYTLNELGSGLTQFVLVLANAAIKRPQLVLIDEPELSLHPSLQLDFLTTLAAYASRGVLFATHSIGLARAAAERVFSVRRLAQGVSDVRPYEDTPRLSEFLGALSFSGHGELGFEKVLLVEGPTEVTTFQQFLRHHKADHRVLLLPLGGASTINGRIEAQLAELKRISPHVAAVVDSEREGPNDPPAANVGAFVQACQASGVTCCVLDRRATENYLTDRAVKLVKGGKYRALQPYERLRDVSPSWAKSENWRIAHAMNRGELEGTDLGQFLAAL